MASRSQGPEFKHEVMESVLEENYRVTPECVFAYPKHPKHVFMQDGPYTEWRYFNCSELLRQIQDIGDKVYPGPEYYPDDYHYHSAQGYEDLPVSVCMCPLPYAGKIIHV